YRPPCPEQEVTNIKDSFEPTDTVYFVTTYRDQLAGQTSTYRILKPDGSLYRTWAHASTREHYSASCWYWAKKLDGDGPPPVGTWSFEVDFEGGTYATHFDVGISRAITVTHPNGGGVWRPPALVPITWQDNLEGDVAVDLYAGGTFHSNIVTSTQSDGLFWWGTGTSLPSRADYTVRITDVTDPVVFDDSDSPFTIARVPTASFTLAPNSGTVPLTVTFTDTSASLVDSWLWDFSDGLTTTLQHPTHVYTDTGAYTVTLAVSGPTGSDTVTHTNAITVTPPPLVADFSAHPILGTPPLTVTFTDRSSGPLADRWAWAFGDGITSTLQHPLHVYTQTGTYTVTLTAGAAGDEDLAVKPRYVHVVDRLWHAYLPVVVRDQAHTGAARTTNGY
ncbi:MAG: PKD domain-containing protein, partial [Anaerolineae bacterium]|nr:PKD domain-containing protein [Anaerolineae bacterium]